MPKLELTKHKGSGQWRKRIGGVDHYFGSFTKVPYKKALREMRLVQLQGKARGELKTVSQLIDRWLEAKTHEVDIGQIKTVTYQKYESVVSLFGSVAGQAKLDNMKGEWFRKIQKAGADRWGYHKQRDLVTVVRMVLSWGADEELCQPVRIPKSFRKPTGPKESHSKALDEERWVWTPSELRAVREALRGSRATYLEPCFLLGLNCGLGNTDISDLRWSHIREVEGVMVMMKPRTKTGRERMVPLWPETIEALGDRGRGIVFRTKGGLPLVGENRRDALGQNFKKVAGKPFYGLRHMFFTIGSQTGDAEAVRFMMGHAPKGMADHYTLSPAWSLPRLTKIISHVRKWWIR